MLRDESLKDLVYDFSCLNHTENLLINCFNLLKALVNYAKMTFWKYENVLIHEFIFQLLSKTL